MKKQNNQINQAKIDIAAEQLARLFIEQAKWKRANKKEKQIIESKVKIG